MSKLLITVDFAHKDFCYENKPLIMTNYDEKNIASFIPMMPDSVEYVIMLLTFQYFQIPLAPRMFFLSETLW